MNKEEAYKILGITQDASADDIRLQYRRLAAKTHPDKGGSAEEFRIIRKAYKSLSVDSICPFCSGKGEIEVRRGAFVDKKLCPRCWKKE